MVVYGITYSDERMTISAEKCVESMRRNGVNEAWQLYPANISQDFKDINDEILSADRGAGYWLWKPYFIDRMLRQCKDGDILVYSDAGVAWIDSPQHIIDVMDQDLFLFTSGHLQHEWCKGSVMALINNEATINREQVQASVIFIRVNDYTKRIVKEWLCWCQMPGLIDDSCCDTNHPDFKEHRHDQAILSAIAIREGLTLHWWADKRWFMNQRYRWPNDKYPPMFIHHRMRNNEYP